MDDSDDEFDVFRTHRNAPRTRGRNAPRAGRSTAAQGIRVQQRDSDDLESSSSSDESSTGSYSAREALNEAMEEESDSDEDEDDENVFRPQLGRPATHRAPQRRGRGGRQGGVRPPPRNTTSHFSDRTPMQSDSFYDQPGHLNEEMQARDEETPPPPFETAPITTHEYRSKESMQLMNSVQVLGLDNAMTLLAMKDKKHTTRDADENDEDDEQIPGELTVQEMEILSSIGAKKPSTISLESYFPTPKRRVQYRGLQRRRGGKMNRLIRTNQPVPKEFHDPNRNYRTKKMAAVVRNEARPVMYRIKTIPSAEYRAIIKRRSRVTRLIAQNNIMQFQLEDPATTTYRNVPEENVMQTIASYIEASRLYIHKSDNYYDQVVPVALEYDKSVKICHFGLRLKKNSCKQKRLKFQLYWWERPKNYIPTQTGQYKQVDQCYVITHDPHLYGCHFLIPADGTSQLKKIEDLYIPRLTKRRTDDDRILDSTYFVREFFLPKCGINFRATRSSDIPDCFVPPTLDAGYFPHCAIFVEDQMHYLACRYREAQVEYLGLTYRSIRPHKGFTVGFINQEELYSFHIMGRHIHGFFVVWESIDETELNEACERVPKRYLVDMFFNMKFPLHVPYKIWEPRLKLAFDRVSVYLLHLTEVIRINRPVFDKLALNKESFFKVLSIKEITDLMEEQEIDPNFFRTCCGNFEFLRWGSSAVNENYLSAFFVICGGTKILRKIETFDLGQTRVFKTKDQELWLHTREGKVIRFKENIKPDTIHLHLTDVTKEKAIEEVEFPNQSIPQSMKRVSRVIMDIPKKAPEAPVPQMRVQNGDTLTRKQLISFRRKIYRLPKPRKSRSDKSGKPGKKKPGKRPDTLGDTARKVHDFDTPYLPSDAESDYEGYLSESEELSESVPKLKRSQSSDSIFLDMNYKDFRFDRLNYFHQHIIHRPKHAAAKVRRRKMNRIVQKHSIRYLTLERENYAFEEMLHCFHANLPRLNDEVSRTKICIRTPYRHGSLNVPEIFSLGDAQLIDTCAIVLKMLISDTVAAEHANIRSCNSTARVLDKVRLARRERLRNLPRTSDTPQPPPKYLAMEYFFLQRIPSISLLNWFMKDLKQFVARCTFFTDCQPTYLMRYNMRKLFIQREEMEFEGYMRTNRLIRRHLDDTLKTVAFGDRSRQYETRREHRRREVRRVLNAKIHVRNNLDDEDAQRQWYEQHEVDKVVGAEQRKITNEIAMETKKKHDEEIEKRIRKEAEKEEEFQKLEYKLRLEHERRQRRAEWRAAEERDRLYEEHVRYEKTRTWWMDKVKGEVREARKLEERRGIRDDLEVGGARQNREEPEEPMEHDQMDTEQAGQWSDHGKRTQQENDERRVQEDVERSTRAEQAEQFDRGQWDDHEERAERSPRKEEKGQSRRAEHAGQLDSGSHQWNDPEEESERSRRAEQAEQFDGGQWDDPEEVNEQSGRAEQTEQWDDYGERRRSAEPAELFDGGSQQWDDPEEGRERSTRSPQPGQFDGGHWDNPEEENERSTPAGQDGHFDVSHWDDLEERSEMSGMDEQRSSSELNLSMDTGSEHQRDDTDWLKKLEMAYEQRVEQERQVDEANQLWEEKETPTEQPEEQRRSTDSIQLLDSDDDDLMILDEPVHEEHQKSTSDEPSGIVQVSIALSVTEKPGPLAEQREAVDLEPGRLNQESIAPEPSVPIVQEDQSRRAAEPRSVEMEEERNITPEPSVPNIQEDQSQRAAEPKSVEVEQERNITPEPSAPVEQLMSVERKKAALEKQERLQDIDYLTERRLAIEKAMQERIRQAERKRLEEQGLLEPEDRASSEEARRLGQETIAPDQSEQREAGEVAEQSQPEQAPDPVVQAEPPSDEPRELVPKQTAPIATEEELRRMHEMRRRVREGSPPKEPVILTEKQKRELAAIDKYVGAMLGNEDVALGKRMESLPTEQAARGRKRRLREVGEVDELRQPEKRRTAAEQASQKDQRHRASEPTRPDRASEQQFRTGRKLLNDLKNFEVDLLTISKDPTNPIYSIARNSFPVSRCRRLITQKNSSFTTVAFGFIQVPVLSLDGYIRSLVENKTPRPIREDCQQLFKNIASCYRFRKTETREKWEFVSNLELLLRDIPASLSEKFDFYVKNISVPRVKQQFDHSKSKLKNKPSALSLSMLDIEMDDSAATSPAESPRAHQSSSVSDDDQYASSPASPAETPPWSPARTHRSSADTPRSQRSGPVSNNDHYAASPAEAPQSPAHTYRSPQTGPADYGYQDAASPGSPASPACPAETHRSRFHQSRSVSRDNDRDQSIPMDYQSVPGSDGPASPRETPQRRVSQSERVSRHSSRNQFVPMASPSPARLASPAAGTPRSRTYRSGQAIRDYDSNQSIPMDYQSVPASNGPASPASPAVTPQRRVSQSERVSWDGSHNQSVHMASPPGHGSQDAASPARLARPAAGTPRSHNYRSGQAIRDHDSNQSIPMDYQSVPGSDGPASPTEALRSHVHQSGSVSSDTSRNQSVPMASPPGHGSWEATSPARLASPAVTPQRRVSQSERVSRHISRNQSIPMASPPGHGSWDAASPARLSSPAAGAPQRRAHQSGAASRDNSRNPSTPMADQSRSVSKGAASPASSAGTPRSRIHRSGPVSRDNSRNQSAPMASPPGHGRQDSASPARLASPATGTLRSRTHRSGPVDRDDSRNQFVPMPGQSRRFGNGDQDAASPASTAAGALQRRAYQSGPESRVSSRSQSIPMANPSRSVNDDDHYGASPASPAETPRSRTPRSGPVTRDSSRNHSSPMSHQSGSVSNDASSPATPAETPQIRIYRSAPISRDNSRNQFIFMDFQVGPVSNDPESPASSASPSETSRSHSRQSENPYDSSLSPPESPSRSRASPIEPDSPGTPQPYQHIPRDVSPSPDPADRIAEEPEVSRPLTLPKKSFSTFWKLVDVCERLVKDDAQKGKINEQILAHIMSDAKLATESVDWIFAVLGACGTFLSKSPEVDEEELSEQDLPQDSIIACAEQVILIASFFHEANKCPANLGELLKHNGFDQVLAPLLQLLTMVHDLSSTSVKPISFVFEKIGDELLNILTDRFGTSSTFADMLALDEAAVESHIVENLDHFKPPSARYRRNVRREERINTMIGWSRAVNLSHRRKIEEIMERSEPGASAPDQMEEDDDPAEQSILSEKTVDEIRKVRSKSAEPPQRSGSSGLLRRCLSSMDLSELTKHAEKKKELVKQMIAPKKTAPGTLPLPLQDQDLLNPQALFTGARNATDVQKYQVIAGMLGYEQKAENSENSVMIHKCISKVFKSKGLLHLVGEPLYTEYNSLVPLGPKRTSIVVEVYRNFLQFRDELNAEVRQLMKAFKHLNSQPEYQQLKDLIDCYEKIFKFYIYLIEHFLDLAGKQIFNPYAIYQAEKTQNVKLIDKEFEKVEQQARSIMMGYLNFSPLKRQLDDLSKISADCSKEKMNCHVASLCRLAILRIRVPQTAESVLNGYGWINSITSHQDTYGLADLKIQRSTPRSFNERDYLQKVARREFEWEFVRKQATSFLASRGKMAPSVVNAALQQSQDLFDAVKVLMPSEASDPKMKIFFQNQFIQVLLGVIFKSTYYPTAQDCRRIGEVHTSLLISAIVDRPCRSLQCTKLVEAVDAVFKKMSRFRVLSLPMCPSTMGVSFNCFGKRLMVSGVKESNPEVQDLCVTMAGKCLNVDEQLMLSTGMGSKFNVIVDSVEGDLSLAWFHLEGNYKDDRIVIANLLKESYKPEIRWDKIVDMYFKSKLNWLNEVLNKEPLHEDRIEAPRLGRMEKPTTRRAPVREDLLQIPDYSIHCL